MSKPESTGAREDRRKREAARFTLTDEQHDAAMRAIDREELRPFIANAGGPEKVLRAELKRFRGAWLAGKFGDREIADCWPDFEPDPESYCPARERTCTQVTRRGHEFNWVTRR